MSTLQGSLPIEQFTSWLGWGERGISSEMIVSHLTGVPVGSHKWSSNHPHDPADFRRCQLLLDAVPIARLALPSMRSVSPVWGRLVDHWDEIHEAIQSEVPDYLGRWATGSATTGYRLMRRVIADGVTCTACDGTGRSDACAKCKGTGRRGGGKCRARDCFGGSHLCSDCRGEGFTKAAA